MKRPTMGSADAALGTFTLGPLSPSRWPCWLYHSIRIVTLMHSLGIDACMSPFTTAQASMRLTSCQIRAEGCIKLLHNASVA